MVKTPYNEIMRIYTIEISTRLTVVSFIFKRIALIAIMQKKIKVEII